MSITQSHGRIALTGGSVILPDRIVSGHAVIVEGSQILGVIAAVELSAIGQVTQILDVGGRFIVPGLIDIHTHRRVRGRLLRLADDDRQALGACGQ